MTNNLFDLTREIIDRSKIDDEMNVNIWWKDRDDLPFGRSRMVMEVVIHKRKETTNPDARIYIDGLWSYAISLRYLLMGLESHGINTSIIQFKPLYKYNNIDHKSAHSWGGEDTSLNSVNLDRLFRELNLKSLEINTANSGRRRDNEKAETLHAHIESLYVYLRKHNLQRLVSKLTSGSKLTASEIKKHPQLITAARWLDRLKSEIRYMNQGLNMEYDLSTLNLLDEAEVILTN